MDGGEEKEEVVARYRDEYVGRERGKGGGGGRGGGVRQQKDTGRR